ncbi:hypothetical protein PoB_001720100 [Plakobranchus ocellatus]|uniref:Uncharacterized protein n=1 Tax=Plakobranchus ocellatus TaxID=259542 RepID=A0AAV3YUD9_9GAST|nr:hypothetical protein PoB_001720100 [Plakobranchus ocellatus]
MLDDVCEETALNTFWQDWRLSLVSTTILSSASPHQGNLRLLGLPSGRGADGGARTRDRRVPAYLRADSQATVLPTPPYTVMD